MNRSSFSQGCVHYVATYCLYVTSGIIQSCGEVWQEVTPINMQSWLEMVRSVPAKKARTLRLSDTSNSHFWHCCSD